MKEIKLDCFLQKEDCQIISPVIKFEIDNPSEKEFVLEIYNHSQNNCQLFLTAKNPNQNDFFSQINLLIISEERLVFQGNLENFFKQKIDLISINANSSKKYFFVFDLTNLFFENKKISSNFDFLFDFNCQQGQENSSISTKAAVLASSVSAITKDNNEIKSGNLFPWSSSFFYLLSSLCVIGFFVIMKIVNGKKKNKA